MTLNWQRGRRLSEFSTFGIGGPIYLFACIRSEHEMLEAFEFLQKYGLPMLILGKGSNCLFHDAGFDGAVLLNRIDFIRWETDCRITAGAGTSFSLLGFKSASRGLKGLEFASGIPASVGGAVFMNAGANGSEASDPLASVSFLTSNGQKRELNKSELEFGYRSSSFQNMDGAILSATFILEKGDDARKKQIEIVEYRKKTQPLAEKSAGCIFRNPGPFQSAGALIDQCGLKGLCIGGAQVSKIHANFLINQGEASAKDVEQLIDVVRREVFIKTGILLEPEIRKIGSFDA